jgi:cytochrome oxidase assembly protein ShyY1
MHHNRKHSNRRSMPMTHPQRARSPGARARVFALARSPRWLAFGVAAVLAAAACLVLGNWQWHRTQDVLASERAALAEPIDLGELLSVSDPLTGVAIGRTVVASGRWESRGQQLLMPRLLGERSGAWVLTGLRLADGSVQPVIRGWVDPRQQAPIPVGPVTVTGPLQTAEEFYPDANPPPGVLVSLNDRLIRERLPGPLRPGVVFLASQRPADRAGPSPVSVPEMTGVVAFPLQNASYALQWLLFAAFAIGAYVFLLIREANREVLRNDDYGSVS